MPLPLRRQSITVELVTFLRSADGIGLTYVRFLVSHYRFTTTVTVFVDTDYGPVIHPFHGLQMYQSAISAYILEVEEPVFSGWGIYPCTLVRAIHRAITLCKHGFPFVRSVYILRTEHYLPTCRYTTCRMEDVVISVTLVEFWSFTGLVRLMSVKYDT